MQLSLCAVKDGHFVPHAGTLRSNLCTLYMAASNELLQTAVNARLASMSPLHISYGSATAHKLHKPGSHKLLMLTIHRAIAPCDPLVRWALCSSSAVADRTQPALLTSPVLLLPPQGRTFCGPRGTPVRLVGKLRRGQRPAPVLRTVLHHVTEPRRAVL